MHHFVIHAYDDEGVKAGQKGKGAYVGCWIRFPDPHGALVLAKFYVRASGWHVRSVKEHYWINDRRGLPPDKSRHFEKAMKIGAAIAYYIYPKRTRPNRRQILCLIPFPKRDPAGDNSE